MAPPRTWRKAYLRGGTTLPQPAPPLIVFGCAFASKDASHEIGVCRACGLEGRSGDTLTCRLAEVWALGQGNFRWTPKEVGG